MAVKVARSEVALGEELELVLSAAVPPGANAELLPARSDGFLVSDAEILEGQTERVSYRLVLRPLVSRSALDFVDSERGRELALSPPLTPDHLIRTKVLPLWVDLPSYDDEERLRSQLEDGLRRYAAAYQAYLARHAARMPSGVEAFDPLPRVVLMPGLPELDPLPLEERVLLLKKLAIYTTGMATMICRTCHDDCDVDLYVLLLREVGESLMRHAHQGMDRTPEDTALLGGMLAELLATVPGNNNPEEEKKPPEHPKFPGAQVELPPV